MSSAKPTIILVHGAWHTAEPFNPLISHLHASGYKTHTVSLPSVGCSPPVEDIQPDIDEIRSKITRCIDLGEDVLLFMHSYGAVPGCEAIKGLTKSASDQEGRQGGVVHLVFCTAFILKEGVSLLGPVGDQPLPWFRLSDDGMSVMPTEPIHTFYNDLSPKVQQEMVAKIQPHSFKTFTTKSTYEGWRDAPGTYLHCEKDNCIPLPSQKAMLESIGIDFRTETFDTDHCPFISIPEQIAMAVRRAAGERV
ncbi:hypothetical protein FRB90_009700 [Tulasnella sp. 427]|nr:hypothetical protein FRB90_009700 [Tulasnella sp. 427]